MPQLLTLRHLALPKAPTLGGRWPATLLGVAVLAVCLGCKDSAPEPSGQEASARDAADPVITGATDEVSTVPDAAPESGFARDIVIVSIDTLRADAPGFSGNVEVRTPNLDRLARRGRVFRRAYAHNVMTLPSHTNILTGKLPWQHGVRDNAGFTLSPDVPTAATVLQEAGFRTAAFVAAFPLDRRYGLGRGFEVYDDRYPEASAEGFAVAERAGDEVVRGAVAWWKEHAGERRFLLVHLYEPHAPYTPPAPWAGEYAENPYLGEVATADAYLGPLFDAILDQTGESSSTTDSPLVVVTSDHGEALGEHGEQTHGLFAYEETLRVPMFVWSRHLTPAVSDRPVSHIDILPTILDAAGVKAPVDLAGHSLLRAGNSKGALYFENLRTHLSRGWAPLRGALRWPDKYIELPIPELYDLARDPDEQDNLAEKRPELMRELASSLSAESSWPPQAGATSALEAARLRALGYLTADATGEARTFGPEDDPKNLVVLDSKLQGVVAAFQTGDLERAETLAREVHAERPQMGLAWLTLAQVLLERNRIELALPLMAEATRRDIAPVALRRQYALTLAEVGRAEQAVAVLEPLRQSADPDTLTALGLVLAEAGQLDRAERTLRSVFSRDAEHALALEHLTRVSVLRGDWREAEKRARQTLERDSDMALTWNYLGLALFNLGRTNEALDAWQASIDRDPDDWDVLFNLGLAAAGAGRADLARPALERFVRAAPSSKYAADKPRARQALGQLR